MQKQRNEGVVTFFVITWDTVYGIELYACPVLFYL
jgi:hypothetical protein